MSEKKEFRNRFTEEQVEILRKMYRFILGPTWGKTPAEGEGGTKNTKRGILDERNP